MDATSTPQVALRDRFEVRQGRILLTGVQALARLTLVQADLDRARGWRTGGFVSGYRGSPLGTVDSTFAGIRDLTDAAGIVVLPAVNEELAATAISGSQQTPQFAQAKVEGVFALWYGKGPGLDRASDAIRHGNVRGASPKGGVVVAIGDDHLSKSSTVACCSDEVAAGLLLPLFYPADAAEVIAYGLHGFALSRYSGSWAALKIMPEVADATRSAPADELQFAPVLPDLALPPMGLHNRWPEMPLEQEVRQREHRLPAVAAYVRANRLDQAHHRTNTSRIGIVAAGKPWLDLLEALRLLGLDGERLQALGIALYKPALIWPLEAEGLREFAAGLETLIAIEEKGPFLESQIKNILYGMTAAPMVLGKHDASGKTLFPATFDLNPERIAAGIGGIIDTTIAAAGIGERLEQLLALLDEQTALAVAPAIRKPFFCSGCPHNRSTVVPEGSRALSGIGCHGLAAYNSAAHSSFAQMGGEGMHWVGLAPFTGEQHVFANMGDGTYFHSGLLAIRQAVAAKVNITYKLLYNSAVAMTGGQAIDGELSVERLVDQIRAEGVATVVVATGDPERYPHSDPLRAKVERIEHRDELQALQRELRERKGVSVIVYEQMCATEKRRLRKRGKLPDPAARVFINERVCEGCGDCSVQSNCLSVEPIETAFGTKRRINQSSCNKDYSCLTGFCPSFVTVEGGKPRKTGPATAAAWMVTLPEPPAAPPKHQRIVVAGIGGTGVVTIGALLSMSTHLSGAQAGVLDQVGMAQKGGAVMSHIHLAEAGITALRIPPGQADLVIACDEIVGNGRDVMAAIAAGRTNVLTNTDVSITGDFTQNRAAIPDATLLERRMAQRAGSEHFAAHPFTRLSERLLGDAIGTNLMAVGFAYQKGWLALDRTAFEAAIELNAVAVPLNKAAFAWGRRLALDPTAVYAAARVKDAEPETLEALIERRSAVLADYQDQAYAARFRATIERVRRAETQIAPGSSLTEAAAHSLFKLMAYKDEYEVARLYTDGSFNKALAEQFEGDIKLSFHMAPPLLAQRDKTTGHLRKQTFGRWMLTAFRVLARFKTLRGTRFDIFGYSSERKTERALIGEFERLLETVIDQLRADNLEPALAIAAAPGEIRGYGHVKEAAIAAYRAKLPEMLARLARPPAGSKSASSAETHRNGVAVQIQSTSF